MKKFTLLTTSAIVIGLLTGAASADTIRFWTTEYQPDRVAKQQAMAADFEKLTGPKILYFINQDYYNLLDRHIEVLKKKYDYILAPNQSIFPKNNIQYLNSETFSIEYTKYNK